MEERSLGRVWLGYGVVMIESLGVLFNLLIFYLIRKQQYKQIDMWLAAIIACCDIIPLLFKVAVFIYSEVVGREFLKVDIVYAQLEGFIIAFFLGTSVAIVGFLALVRYWAIKLKRYVDYKLWMGVIFGQSLLFLIILVLCAINNQFVLMPMGNYFYLDRFSSQPIVFVGIAYFIITGLFSLISVSFCYTSLSTQYSKHLFNTLPEPNGLGYDKLLFKTKKKNQYLKIKIVFTLLLYWICIVPHFVILTIELITGNLRSSTMDVVAVLTIISLPFVNPLTLLLLHDGTFSHLKYLFCKPT